MVTIDVSCLRLILSHRRHYCRQSLAYLRSFLSVMLVIFISIHPPHTMCVRVCSDLIASVSLPLSLSPSYSFVLFPLSFASLFFCSWS